MEEWEEEYGVKVVSSNGIRLGHVKKYSLK